jgi:hypothetical protein
MKGGNVVRPKIVVKNIDSNRIIGIWMNINTGIITARGRYRNQEFAKEIQEHIDTKKLHGKWDCMIEWLRTHSHFEIHDATAFRRVVQ